MKFTISVSILSRHLTDLLRVIPNRTTLPIIQGVLFSADKGLELLATNLDQSVIIIEDEVVIEEKGKVVVPAKLFERFFTLLPQDETLSFETKKDSVLVKAGGQEITIKTLSADDFPNIESVKGESFAMESETLINGLSKTITCAFANDTLPIIKSVALVMQGKTASFRAFDGFRLGLFNHIELGGSVKDTTIVIARETVENLVKIGQGRGGFVKITVSENKIQFEWGNIMVIGLLVEGNFPDFATLSEIPPFPTQITFQSSRLKNALGVVELFDDKKSNFLAVLFAVQGENMIVSSVENETGKGVSVIPFEQNGALVPSFAFNLGFIKDFISCTNGEKVTFQMNNPNAAFVKGESPEEARKKMLARQCQFTNPDDSSFVCYFAPMDVKDRLTTEQTNV